VVLLESQPSSGSLPNPLHPACHAAAVRRRDAHLTTWLGATAGLPAVTPASVPRLGAVIAALTLDLVSDFSHISLHPVGMHGVLPNMDTVSTVTVAAKSAGTRFSFLDRSMPRMLLAAARADSGLLAGLPTLARQAVRDWVYSLFTYTFFLNRVFSSPFPHFTLEFVPSSSRDDGDDGFPSFFVAGFSCLHWGLLQSCWSLLVLNNTTSFITLSLM
jgi:hypothetical protein